jgi:hypothetical protein
MGKEMRFVAAAVESSAWRVVVVVGEVVMWSMVEPVAVAVVLELARLGRGFSVLGVGWWCLDVHLDEAFGLCFFSGEAVLDEGAEHVSLNFLVWSKPLGYYFFGNATIAISNVRREQRL